jgi:hypothetical protein
LINIGGSITIIKEYTKEIKPVFISDDKVTPAELKGAMRNGCREATPAEIALMYVYGDFLQRNFDLVFANELHEKGAVRTSIKGLGGRYGYHEIQDNGSFTHITDIAKFAKLPSQRRALLIPGDSYLMFGCHLPHTDGDPDAYLKVSADDFDDMTQIVRIDPKTRSVKRLNLDPELKKHHFAYVKEDSETVLVKAHRYLE